MKKTFNIYGMHCAGCANSAQKALKNVKGVQSVSVQLTTGKAVVEFENGNLPVEDLKQAVSNAGYELKVPEQKKVTFDVMGMHCAGCTSTVEKAIKNIDLVTDATVNLATETATVEYDGPDQVINEIIEAVSGAGYQFKKKG